MQPVSQSVARSRDTAGNIAFIERASLAPIFEVCHNRGLVINDANRVARLYAVNRYFDFLPFDWIEASFKELLHDRAAILVVADAIQAGVLSW